MSGFITYTDSETWAGNIHPAQALRQYRNEFVGDTKAVVVGMTSNGFHPRRPERPRYVGCGWFRHVSAGRNRELCSRIVSDSRTPRPGNNADGGDSIRLHLQFLSRWPISSGGGLQNRRSWCDSSTGFHFVSDLPSIVPNDRDEDCTSPRFSCRTPAGDLLPGLLMRLKAV